MNDEIYFMIPVDDMKELESFAKEVVETKGGDFNAIFHELRRLYRAGQVAFKNDIVTSGVN